MTLCSVFPIDLDCARVRLKLWIICSFIVKFCRLCPKVLGWLTRDGSLQLYVLIRGFGERFYEAESFMRERVQYWWSFIGFSWIGDLQNAYAVILILLLSLIVGILVYVTVFSIFLIICYQQLYVSYIFIHINLNYTYG